MTKVLFYANYNQNLSNLVEISLFGRGTARTVREAQDRGGDTDKYFRLSTGGTGESCGESGPPRPSITAVVAQGTLFSTLLLPRCSTASVFPAADVSSSASFPPDPVSISGTASRNFRELRKSLNSTAGVAEDSVAAAAAPNVLVADVVAIVSNVYRRARLGRGDSCCADVRDSRTIN